MKRLCFKTSFFAGVAVLLWLCNAMTAASAPAFSGRDARIPAAGVFLAFDVDAAGVLCVTALCRESGRAGEGAKLRRANRFSTPAAPATPATPALKRGRANRGSSVFHPGFGGTAPLVSFSSEENVCFTAAPAQNAGQRPALVVNGEAPLFFAAAPVVDGRPAVFSANNAHAASGVLSLLPNSCGPPPFAAREVNSAR